MGGAQLDFGLMCSGTMFADWQADCIRTLREVDGVNLQLLIIDDADSTRASGLREKVEKVAEYRERTRTSAAINKIAWWLYRRPYDHPPCMDQVDLSEELKGIDRIACDVEEDGFSQYFYEDDMKEIREYELDVILRMSFGIIRGEILEIPRYGVWSFHHDDERKYRGGPPCFWEIYNGDPVTGAILQRLTDRLDGGIVLKRGTFPTKRRFQDNLNNVYYGSSEWPAQVARDILNGNAAYVDQSPTESDAPIYRAPSTLQIASYNVKKIYSLGAETLRGIGHWNVGVAQHSIAESIKDRFDPDVDWYEYPRVNGFLADPFPITIAGSTYIFVEDFSYPDWKGKISYLEYPEGFVDGDRQTAHEEPYHMSYPYLFEHDGDVYATPEIHEANEIRLYRVHSPSRWEHETTLVEDVGGVDPTVVKHRNRWWLFYTEQSYPNTKLYVQHSDDPTGDWMPHENNPVKTDVRSARPGGTPFVHDDTLYRPAQNSAGGYGQSLVINRVERLTRTQFVERKASEIRPSEDGPYTGMHTLSSRSGVTLIDAKTQVRNRHAFRRRLSQIQSALGL